MLTTEPLTASRRMIRAHAWMRKNGARTLSANIVSHPSGVASQMLSRNVAAATLTRPWTTPKRASAASATTAGAAASPMSASTKIVAVPPAVSSVASASPLSRLRPASTSPEARAAAHCRAVASPRPCVPPLTTMILPERSFMHQTLFRRAFGALVRVKRSMPCDCRRTRTSEAAGGSRLTRLLGEIGSAT